MEQRPSSHFLSFLWNLYHKAASSAADGNCFISPASVAVAVAMTYLGTDGDSKKELEAVLFGGSTDEKEIESVFNTLQQALNDSSSTSDNVTMSSANRMYCNRGYKILDEFVNQLKSKFSTEIEQIDFSNSESSRQKINSWVMEKTERKIHDLIGPSVLSELTRLVLVNAVYFKGNWDKQFQTDQTWDRQFYVQENRTLSVPMMSQKDTFHYYTDEELQVLGLTYAGNDLCMYFFLPKVRDQLKHVEQTMTGKKLQTICMQCKRKSVIAIIPKFKMEYSLSLKPALNKMNVASIFNESDADFRRITGNRDLFVSEVVHKAFVEINEEGTEAAAATAVVCSNRCLIVEDEPTEFLADHPFFFAIVDQKNYLPLFIGRYIGLEQ